jgi:hypothetical protein
MFKEKNGEYSEYLIVNALRLHYCVLNVEVRLEQCKQLHRLI